MTPDPIIEKLRPLHGGRILDVACGFGDFLKLLTDSFHDFTEAVGIDRLDRADEAARRNPDRRLQFRRMDAEHIEYDDAHFDTVAIRHSLHHLTHPDVVFAEMARVLKPGGLFVFGEVYLDPATQRPNSQRHLHHFWAEVDRVFDIPHYDTVRRTEIVQMVEKAGLRAEEVFDYREDASAAETKESLDAMLKYTAELIEKLRAAGSHEDLIEKGQELIERFGRDGFVDENMVYIIARKP